MKDDVDPATKQRRLAEVIEVFRENVQQRNVKSEMGKLRVVPVDDDSRRSTKDVGESKERLLQQHWGDRRKGALRPPPEARRGANGDREARRRRGRRVHLGHGQGLQRGVGEEMH